MPIYFFKLEEYRIIEAREMDDDSGAPQTLINLDKNGSGNLAFHAANAERAKLFADEHLRIHRQWDDTDGSLQ